MHICALTEADILNGTLETLNSLSKNGNLPEKRLKAIFQQISNNPNHYVFVMKEDGKVVGIITLLVEQKLIHQGGRVGHIEDVAVRRGWQKRGIGKQLVEHAIATARALECYKVILNCNKSTISFYEKCGLYRYGIEMRLDL